MNSVILDSIKALYFHNTQPIDSDDERELIAGGYVVRTPKKGLIVSRAGRDLLRAYCGIICEAGDEPADSMKKLNKIMHEKAAASARMEEALQLNANPASNAEVRITIDPKIHHVQEDVNAEPTFDALKVQIGGEHYKNLKIQPVEFIEANNLGFLEGCIIKRICRHADKNGVQDLQKIKHECDLLIQLRYSA